MTAGGVSQLYVPTSAGYTDARARAVAIGVGLGFAYVALLKLGHDVQRVERERRAAVALLAQRDIQLAGAVREIERREASERAAETERDIEARLGESDGD